MSRRRKSITNLSLVFLLTGILFFVHVRNLRTKLIKTKEVKTERVE